MSDRAGLRKIAAELRQRADRDALIAADALDQLASQPLSYVERLHARPAVLLDVRRRFYPYPLVLPWTAARQIAKGAADCRIRGWKRRNDSTVKKPKEDSLEWFFWKINDLFDEAPSVRTIHRALKDELSTDNDVVELSVGRALGSEGQRKS